MATQQIANLALVGRWIVSQEMIERDQDAGRAEPTLQRVVPPECCLQNAEPLSRWSYPLYCAQIATVGLYRERKTSPRQHAIDDDRRHHKLHVRIRRGYQSRQSFDGENRTTTCGSASP
jgi:hypothetical protein